ncbi:hypothetical protein Sste5346_005118 [Sporothrix stenoceras]|uniref:Xylanolytic transcriptional activator regulatory domain-containing protein n=1 Tax=Sporothrix stenoceras TaxID=5173 RepID=A0ABR3Z752_9PEZI
MRSGAIEHLNHRISTLEKMFLGQGVLWQQVANCLGQVQSKGSSVPKDFVQTSQNLHDYTAKLRTTLLSLADAPVADGESQDKNDDIPPNKRQKSDTNTNARTLNAATISTTTPSIDLPDDLQSDLVNIYFQRLHPWIPMLHEHQFRQKLASPDPKQRQRLVNILYAITSLCIRFSDDVRLGASPESRTHLAKTCRDTVILQSMQSFSVENLQALIICAFDTISSGQSPSAWSIIGSMTRTVEQLQLSVEDEDQPQARPQPRGKATVNVLIRRIAFLPPARDWVELEERRRVFWNVFLMDRFCSIATGWNLSLTSADVKRRLPCEGALWEEGRIEVPTPYFGVSEPSDGAGGEPPTNGDSLGAFAYCIEATESLSLVTSFFLQQGLDVTDTQSVQLWLMRFKQLDLRLVRWKLFLPERWRDANSRNADNNLDPNLVVAHITHNTAVVLLHQGIAYPSEEWRSVLLRLPSPSSAETCLAAATEVAAIATHVLREKTDLLTNPQIAFCLFICGRMVLAHSKYYRLPTLPAAFDSMTDSLWEIARRWRGTLASEDGNQENLASKFASRLAYAKQMGASLDIRQAAYSEDADTAVASTTTADHFSSTVNNNSMAYAAPISTQHQPRAFDSPDNDMSLAFPPLPLAFQSGPINANSGNVTMDNGTTSASAFDSIQGSMQSSVYGQPTAITDYSSSVSVGGIDRDKDMLEDLNSFLDYSFLPDQRVSIYTLPDV